MAKLYSFKYKGWALGAGAQKGIAYAIQLDEAGRAGAGRHCLFVPRTPEEGARSALIAFADRIAAEAHGGDPLVADVLEAYRAKLESENRASHKQFGSYMKRLCPVFGHLRVSSLSVALCKSYAVQREKDGYARHSIHGDLARLSHAIKWGSHAGAMYKEDHHRRLWNISTPPPRDRVLSPDEFHRLHDAATSIHTRLLIMLGLLTTQRIGALLALRWDQVDLDTGTIDFRPKESVKNILDKGYRKNRAIVKIAPQLMAALSAAKSGAKTAFVLEYQGRGRLSNPYEGFRAAVASAGLGSDVTPHVLRHTALSWGSNEGVLAEYMTKLSGHKSDKVFKSVYVHPDANASAPAVDAISRKLGSGIRRVK